VKSESILGYKSLTNICEDALNENKIYSHHYCVDRTGTYVPKLPFKYDISNHIMPELDNNFLSLEDCITKRCLDLFSRNKKIILMYSGGIDSLCCLVGLIRNYGIDKCCERIIICANKQSRDSNPVFYDTFIQGKFEIIDSTNSNITLADVKYHDMIIVNGDPANVFDGAVLLEKIMRLGIPLDDSNWKQQVKEYHPQLFKSCDGAYEHLIEVIESSAASRNYHINNVFDFVWWYNNNLFYMVQSLNMLKNYEPILTANKLGKEYWVNRFIPFFQTDYFTLWSFNIKHEVMKNKLTNNIYKKHFKEYINEIYEYDLTDNIGNSGFSKHLSKQVKQFLFLDENYTPIYQS
jgi:hypothetical protein